MSNPEDVNQGPMLRHHSRSSRTWVAPAIGLALLLSGCTGSVERSAAILGIGSKVCIENRSSRTIPVTLKTVDTHTGSNPIPPQGGLCAEGTFSGGLDLVAGLDLGPGNLPVWINVTNQSVGYPRLALIQKWGSGSGDLSNCMSQGFAAMETVTTNDGILEYTAVRLPDSEWKEFRLTLRDDPNPSPTGKSRGCVSA